MLGLRRYGGVQIDLFQGGPGAFVADVLVEVDAGSESSFGGFTPAPEPRRHVAYAVKAGDATRLLTALKEFLDRTGHASNIRRATFLLPDLERYRSFQEALFRLFPEDL